MTSPSYSFAPLPSKTQPITWVRNQAASDIAHTSARKRRTAPRALIRGQSEYSDHAHNGPAAKANSEARLKISCECKRAVGLAKIQNVAKERARANAEIESAKTKANIHCSGRRGTSRANTIMHATTVGPAKAAAAYARRLTSRSTVTTFPPHSVRDSRVLLQRKQCGGCLETFRLPQETGGRPRETHFEGVR